jgi:multidrug efflux pump subunit AcrA (membrane-fusion protein)
MQMRTRALERRRMPDELDRMLIVAPSRAWLAVLALAMAVAGLVVWGFTGHLPRQLSASGVLSAGPQSSVQSMEVGRVERVTVAAGDVVKVGQRVVTLAGPPSRQIASPFAGRVATVDVAPGQVIERGSSLYTLQPSASDVDQLSAVVFLSAQKGATVTRGMAVNVQIASAPASAFGVVRGHVASVSTYPASNASLTALLGNPDLAAQFSRSGPPVVARIRLDLDRSTPSGLRWSTGKGAPFPLQPGVSVSAQIVQGTQSPADVLFGS